MTATTTVKHGLKGSGMPHGRGAFGFMVGNGAGLYQNGSMSKYDSQISPKIVPLVLRSTGMIVLASSAVPLSGHKVASNQRCGTLGSAGVPSISDGFPNGALED
jgi:hypothetical protein